MRPRVLNGLQAAAAAGGVSVRGGRAVVEGHRAGSPKLTGAYVCTVCMSLWAAEVIFGPLGAG